MRFRLVPAALGIAGLALLIGCMTKPNPVPEAVPAETSTPAEEPKATPVETPVEPQTQPEVQPDAQPEVQPVETPPQEEPKAEPQPEPPVQAAEVVVTEEVYAKTFDELEARIKEWSAIIARKDYDTWYANLSRAYVAERGSATYLAELSKNQKLREKGISLKSLRDYFLYVVVPARFEAALDRIEFVSRTKVKAYADIGGEPAILYYVVREDDVWKIGTSAE
jgi:hypothetical protein